MRRIQRPAPILIRCFASSIALALLIPAGQALAAQPTTTNDEGGEVTQQGDTRAITYDGDDIDGDLPRPSGERISARHSAKHPSLIKLRVRFNDHLIRLSRDI